ncbi:Fe-S-cluster-containing hydrogenase subunit [Desulfosporosinus orientis DSM 765]|uniref:Fe-S-cluster-containing hydrogenase subunit n=1 Tax=Desulfosporosinus orientis (strain ATCC 19365 / DSM 765 / NCIMB 8382 / VKM B-1628 / Singapore I) TaxID=768706 RepID=G7W4Z0_DESOD|nr:4Fe-4S dicluster domain-containing protein [Desulfosporosinus orientis]AET65862.1 Fe-S-cluster-containing hydrogenase subunit [Desulfosporosinus orientis DSM 765]
MNQHAMLVDVSRCIECKSCIVACKQENGLQTGDWWLRVWRKEQLKDHLVRYYNTQSCRHCVDPVCQAVCPVGSIQRGEDGRVIQDDAKCLGCHVCVTSCPHHGMKIMTNGKVGKCTLCSHRLARGKEPACAGVCPTNSRIYGGREELLREASKRMEELRMKGMHVHLEGGDKDQTMVMYLFVDTES